MLDWNKYIQVASKFQRKVKKEDKQDIVSDIILRCAEVESKYNGNGEHLTEGGMVRIASFTILAYWRDEMRLPQIISLNGTVSDGEGNETEFYQTLADDNAINVDDWLDAKLWLHRAPPRLIKLAHKKVYGIPLTHAERSYLNRERQLILNLA